MKKHRRILDHLFLCSLGILALLGLYLASRYNFLLFHAFAELFSIAIAFGMFMFAWNTRGIIDNNYLLLLGIAYLFVGFLDGVHTLAYRGMGIFGIETSNLATQLWISARYLESATLMVAPLLLRRMPGSRFLLAGYTAVTALVLAAIFRFHVFPTCYVEGVGLTLFKRMSEYVIMSILLAALLLLYRARREFDRSVFAMLTASILATVASEFMFTLYLDVYGPVNLIGHYLKIVSFYLVYKAIIETGLVKPYSLLFRRLKQHEEELSQKADIIDQTHDSIISTDHRRCVASWNRGAERMFGYTARDAIGKEISFLYAGGAPQQLTADTMRIVEAQGSHEFETRMRRRSGEEFWGHVSLSLLRSGEDRSPGTVKYIIDVTPRRIAEAALKAEKEFTDAALNAQTDTFFVLDPAEGKAIRWNQAFSRVSGYSDDEIRRMKAPDSYYGEEDLKKAARATERLLRDEVTTLEMSLITKDGRLIPTEYTASTLTDSETSRRYIIAVGRDVSERKRAEEERARVAQLKDQFVRIASHDLKNPLMSVNGLVNFVQELIPIGERMTHEAYDCLARIRRSAEVMYNIVINFLDFHALEDGRVRLQFERVDLNDIARHVVELNRDYSRKKRTAIELRQHDGLPLVSADKYRIHQVIENLVNNAVKFSPAESSVVVSSREDGQWVILEVCDTGPGFTDEDMRQLFVKYARLRNRPTGGEKGSGLGLAICRHLIGLHGGEIGARNNPDSGCTFWFRLPVVPPAP